MLIDTHAHLTDEIFVNKKEIVENFKKDNIELAITTSYSKQSIKEVFKLAQTYKNVFGVIGIHPNDANDFDNEAITMIKKYSKNKKILGIGEVGLDYHWLPEDLTEKNKIKTRQKEVFIHQIQLANELRLPIVIHQRDAIQDLLEILEKHPVDCGGIFHCFSESVEIFNKIKKMGYKISVGGVVTFKNAKTIQSVVQVAELKDFVLETDCPYLTPEPFRAKETNQPKFIKFIAQKIADIKAVDIDKIEEQTRRNVFEIFKKLNLEN